MNRNRTENFWDKFPTELRYKTELVWEFVSVILEKREEKRLLKKMKKSVDKGERRWYYL